MNLIANTKPIQAQELKKLKVYSKQLAMTTFHLNY
jgi:hypothetical protein